MSWGNASTYDEAVEDRVASRAGGRLRTRNLVLALVAAATIVVGSMTAPSMAVAADNNLLIEETFRGNALNSSAFIGGGSGVPCLTVAGATGNPASCADTGNTSGNGAIRLTAVSENKAGYLLYNNALPTSGGIDVSFTQYQWGTSGTYGDGIAFFLTDGAYGLTTPGPFGAALGYNASDVRGTNDPGLAHALLGINIDAYGNSPRDYNAPGCTIRPTASLPDAISVRGPAGDIASSTGSMNGYCLIGNPVTITGGVDNPGTSARPGGYDVRVVVDPPSAVNPQVKVYWNNSATPIVTVDQPDALKNASSFKFGWAASTGGATNNHEITDLVVSSVAAVAPAVSLAAEVTVDGEAGKRVTVPFVATALNSGGAITTPTAFTVTVPSGMTFDGAPSGTGWSCGTPSGSSVICTFTPPQGFVSPGTALPTLSVPVVTQRSGSFPVEMDGAIAVDSAQSAVEVIPSAADENVVATAGDAVVTVTPPAAVGTGPFTYELVSTGDADGSVSINPTTGEITFVPTEGSSGISEITYRVVDGSGTPSAPALVTVDVEPDARPAELVTDVDTVITLDLTTISTGTDLSYTIVQPAKGGVVVMDENGIASFTPDEGFSGRTSFDYVVTDADGLTTTETVEVIVRPSTPSGPAITVPSGSSGTFTPGAPEGIGPFTYRLDRLPTAAEGTATIDERTGVITFVPAPGFSGTATFSYVVIDGDGIASAPAEVSFVVALPNTGATITPALSIAMMLLLAGMGFIAYRRLRLRA